MGVLGTRDQTIDAFEVRRQFGKILQKIARGNRVVVKWHGDPVAAVVPIELYDQWKRRREEFFEKMRTVSERVNLSEEEAQKVVARAIRAVRTRKRA